MGSMRHSAQRWRWKFIMSVSVDVRFSLTSAFQVFSTITNHLAGNSPDSFITNMPSSPLGASVLTPPPAPPASREEQCGTLRPASATAQHNPGNTVLLATCLTMSPAAFVSRSLVLLPRVSLLPSFYTLPLSLLLLWQILGLFVDFIYFFSSSGL